MGAFPPASSDANKPAAPEPADAGCSGNLFALARELKTLTERLQEAFANDAVAPDVDNLVRDTRAVGDVLQKALPAPPQPAAIEAPVAAPACQVDHSIPYHKRTDIDFGITSDQIMNASTEEERIQLISKASEIAIQNTMLLCSAYGNPDLAELVCRHYNKFNGPLNILYPFPPSLRMCKILLPHIKNRYSFAFAQPPEIFKVLCESLTFAPDPKWAYMNKWVEQLEWAATNGDLPSFRFIYHTMERYYECANLWKLVFSSAVRRGNRDILRFLRDPMGFNIVKYRKCKETPYVQSAEQIAWLKEDLLFTDRDFDADFVKTMITVGSTKVIIEAVRRSLIPRESLSSALKDTDVVKSFVMHL